MRGLKDCIEESHPMSGVRDLRGASTSCCKYFIHIYFLAFSFLFLSFFFFICCSFVFFHLVIYVAFLPFLQFFHFCFIISSLHFFIHSCIGMDVIQWTYILCSRKKLYFSLADVFHTVGTVNIIVSLSYSHFYCMFLGRSIRD